MGLKTYSDHTSRSHRSLFFIVLLALLGVFLVYFLVKSDLSPINFSAIFGGEEVSGDVSPFAGYLIAYDKAGSASLCGTVYLSDSVAISAAHCFQNIDRAYLGHSVFNSRIDEHFLAQDINSHPGWQNTASDNDVAVLQIPQDFYDIAQYAEIVPPRIGCHYEVIGYGRNDRTDPVSQLTKLRLKGKLCLEKFDNGLLYFTGDGAGICQGDSGSAVFERNSNRVVGVVSSIVVSSDSSGNPCAIGNRALVVRLDTQSDFINSSTNLSKCGESCAQKSCMQGLVCGADQICNSPAGPGCSNSLGAFCSAVASVSCRDNAVCSANKCVSEDMLGQNQTILNTSLSMVFGSEESNTVNTVRLVSYALFAASIAVVAYSIVYYMRRR